MDWDSAYIQSLISSALMEDVGSGNVAAAATVSPSATATAHIAARQELVCAGLPLVERILGRLDADMSVKLLAADGQRVVRDAILLKMSGNASAILTGEQTALNVLSWLCGIATRTREYADQIEGTRTKIRDTRITTPGLRAIEQYAIRMGGGAHHHAGSFDAIVLTHAHIAAAGGIKPALDQAHSHTSRLMNPLAISAYEATGTMPAGIDTSSLPIQIEVRHEGELREAFSAGAESILLTDLPAHEIGELVKLARTIRRGCVIEFSGDISVSDARAYAEAGVDYLSPRALTAAAPWASLRLLVDSLQEK
jgi:nicotinate-nucleotide pyrophosphorylase (carboxylating)